MTDAPFLVWDVSTKVELIDRSSSEGLSDGKTIGAAAGEGEGRCCSADFAEDARRIICDPAASVVWEALGGQVRLDGGYRSDPAGEFNFFGREP